MNKDDIIFQDSVTAEEITKANNSGKIIVCRYNLDKKLTSKQINESVSNFFEEKKIPKVLRHKVLVVVCSSKTSHQEFQVTAKNILKSRPEARNLKPQKWKRLW